MKKNLEILGVEDTKDGRPRETSNGKRYARIKTPDGWMSCFQMKEVEKMKALLDKTASLEVVETGEFNNIKKCYGEAGKVTEDEDSEEVEVKKMTNVTVKENNHATMYTSYAKDIFCELVKRQENLEFTDQMAKAIELVKQAKEAFQ